MRVVCVRTTGAIPALVVYGAIGAMCLFAAPICSAEPAATQPPISTKFVLDQPGYVTLVVEDAEGKRVRNLVSETLFPAGENTVWWDGLDDLDRDTEAAWHSVYHIPGKLVPPGVYTVRGLVRPEIGLTYQLGVYNAGSPPWVTEDPSSYWLANHTPPSAVCFVPAGAAPVRPSHPTSSGPQILVGSYVTEGGSGVAWLDLEGRKLHGQHWIGGIWTGATHIAYDAGSTPVAGVYAYTGSAWARELRLNQLLQQAGTAPEDARLGYGEDRPVLESNWRFPDAGATVLGGLTVHNGLVVSALPELGQLVFVDAHRREVVGTAALERPGGLAFDAEGRLYAVAGKTVVRLLLDADPTSLSTPEVLVRDLEDPQQVTLDGQGNLYVSDWGASHQVKVYDPQGELLRTIGKPGVPSAGRYDPEKMHHPAGLTVDSSDRLWVAENDHQPKRLSVWTLDGSLVEAFYGPPRYGGGGTLDPQDKTLFHFYGMTFKLDWETGKSWPIDIFYRWDNNDFPLRPLWEPMPETPFYFGDHKYMTNAYNGEPTRGGSAAVLWRRDEDQLRPVAAVGSADGWPMFSQVSDPSSNYSVRWTGQIQPKYTETYTIYTHCVDGVRLWVDGRMILEHWQQQAPQELSAQIPLEAGQRYDLRMEYVQGGGTALAFLSWESPSQPKEIVPSSALYPSAEATEPGGLTGHYYKGTSFEVLKGSRVDPHIVFNWTHRPPELLMPEADDPLLARWPADLQPGDRLLVVWSDLNGNGKVEAEECTFLKGTSGPVTVMSDLAFVVSRLDDRVVRLAPQGFTPTGAPLYDAARAETMVTGAQGPTSSGGDQVLVAGDGWTICTTAPKPFAPQGMGGAKDGVPRWSYPSLWPGLHASVTAPLPESPGQLIGTTRLLGPLFSPRGGEAGEMWALNGNKGNVYLFTSDGLFVATLFEDSRRASWNAPEAIPGMSVAHLSAQEENFWPSITQTSDGEIYLTTYNCVVKVEGLDQIKRLPATEFAVTPEVLEVAQAHFLQREAERQAAQLDQGPLVVALREAPLTVDGQLDDWSDAQWVAIDTRREIVSRWQTQESVTKAAVAVAGDRLYAAFQARDPRLLNNPGVSLQNLFKGGGCLDLMLDSVPGGVRLLVTQVQGRTLAALYRPQVPGTTRDPVVFASPLRTIHFDRVDDVSEQVELAGADGNYELSVALELLSLTPQEGLTLSGDVGLLRGDGVRTLQRVYWHNKATGLVSDIPAEVELTPQLWGKWVFTAAPGVPQ